MLPPPAVVFESDLSSDREGIGGGASPVAVRSGCSFESLDEKVLGTGPSRTSVSRRSGVVEALAGVEFGELLMVEVTEAACEVAVRLARRPRGA